MWHAAATDVIGSARFDRISVQSSCWTPALRHEQLMEQSFHHQSGYELLSLYLLCRRERNNENTVAAQKKLFSCMSAALGRVITKETAAATTFAGVNSSRLQCKVRKKYIVSQLTELRIKMHRGAQCNSEVTDINSVSRETSFKVLIDSRTLH